jgi:hypothetical protein
LKRLFFHESKGKVRYQYDNHGLQEELVDYLEIIARVTSHIPDKDQVIVRYYGLYFNAHRGKLHKVASALSPPPIIEEEPNYVPSNCQAEMICKIYEVDLLLCPRCGDNFTQNPKPECG